MLGNSVRYNVPPTIDEQTKKTIQLRVVNALKTWLDLSFSDFDQDTRLFGKLNDFVDITLVNDGNAKLQTKLRDFIMRKVHYCSLKVADDT